MGYYIDQVGCKFHIAASKKETALKTLKEVITGSLYGWVDEDELLKATTLEEFFSAFRWDAITDESGDIIDLEFTGSKLGDDEVLFYEVARYVSPDSYVEIKGEDSDRWRWIFDGCECRTVDAKLVWEY